MRLNSSRQITPVLVFVVISIWYKIKSNLEVHLFEPGQLYFVQVHFTTDKVRPGSAKIFFVEPEVEPCPENSKS